MAYDAAPAVGGKTAEVTDYARQFESLKQLRLPYDRKWQFVSDYILPRRDFSVTQRPDQLRPHRVTSSVATNANARMAALVLAYAVDPTRPFLLPNVKRGLAMAGRPTNLDNPGLDYLNNLEWQIYSHMVLPRAQLMLRLGAALLEFCSFGDGVIWTGRRRGFGPYYNTRPLQACWWSENEEGVIDTLFFRMQWPLWRVLARWPEEAEKGRCVEVEGERPARRANVRAGDLRRAPARWGQGRRGDRKQALLLSDLRREGGRGVGAVGLRLVPLCGAALQPHARPGLRRGPRLPGASGRHGAQSPSAGARERRLAARQEPAIGIPARMFGKTLDRRPGAVNAYNPTGLGLLRADQAIMKLDFTGDPTEAINVRSGLIQDIELGFFVDWLRLRESGDIDRRGGGGAPRHAPAGHVVHRGQPRAAVDGAGRPLAGNHGC